MSGEYVLPLFYLPKVWVAYWSQLRYPAKLPLSGFDLDTWWSEAPK
jgi:peptide/nickel transport system substrate-binding protein